MYNVPVVELIEELRILQGKRWVERAGDEVMFYQDFKYQHFFKILYYLMGYCHYEDCFDYINRGLYFGNLGEELFHEFLDCFDNFFGLYLDGQPLRLMRFKSLEPLNTDYLLFFHKSYWLEEEDGKFPSLYF